MTFYCLAVSIDHQPLAVAPLVSFARPTISLAPSFTPCLMEFTKSKKHLNYQSKQRKKLKKRVSKSSASKSRNDVKLTLRVASL